MNRSTPLLLLALAACANAGKNEPPKGTESVMAESIHDLTMNRLDGKAEKLDSYKGKVALVVNTASECGYTPQYEGLEKLYGELSAKDFVVLGFPSNEFGKQEPGSSEDIRAFCQKNYGVTFPMFEKVETKGGGAAPLYKILSAKGGGEPKWNFHKYLVGKDGAVIKGYPSSVAPDDGALRKDIEAALAAD
jgi:glutathione peroxidase